MVDTESRSGIALRVEVDEEHCQSAESKGSREIHAGGRFADAALLVRYNEDPGGTRRWQCG